MHAERESKAQNLIEDCGDLFGRKERQQSLIHVREGKNVRLLAAFAQALGIAKAQRINDQCCGAFGLAITDVLVGDLDYRGQVWHRLR